MKRINPALERARRMIDIVSCELDPDTSAEAALSHALADLRHFARDTESDFDAANIDARVMFADDPKE